MRMKSLLCFLMLVCPLFAGETNSSPRAFIDGTGPGWRAMTQADFTNVNSHPTTWTFTNNMILCTGQPIGVIRHLHSGGNSGVFLWATPESIRALETGNPRLPAGIEVQVLDHGYTEQYERDHKRKADWFTTNGDVFPTGNAKMKPFPPVSPSGDRSFPSKNLSKGVGQWNHYYVRAINGEVRLWVNGEEVSGGTDCRPATGYLCLESEGAPIEFRNLRIRELP
jgi:hypothetical protein